MTNVCTRIQGCHMHPTISPSSTPRKDIFNPSLQSEFMSANSTQSFSFSLDTTLVNKSAGFSFVWIFSNSNDLCSATSLNQWYLTSMCFERAWYIEFLLKSIVLWLSQLNTYPSCFKPKEKRCICCCFYDVCPWVVFLLLRILFSAGQIQDFLHNLCL